MIRDFFTFLQNADVNISDLIIQVFSSLILVITVFITNYITVKINNKNIKLNIQQFNESMLTNKKLYDMQLMQQEVFFEKTMQKENIRNRISIMPYFEIDEEMKIDYSDGELIFPIKFTNIGNGTAIRTNLMIGDNLVAYEDTVMNIKYIQSAPMSRSAVKCEQDTETIIKTEYNENAQEVQVKISFEDMMQRQYVQKFSFYYKYGYNTNISVQKHFSPECIKDNI